MLMGGKRNNNYFFFVKGINQEFKIISKFFWETNSEIRDNKF